MIAKEAGTPPEENICHRKDMWKGKGSQFPFLQWVPNESS